MSTQNIDFQPLQPDVNQQSSGIDFHPENNTQSANYGYQGNTMPSTQDIQANNANPAAPLPLQGGIQLSHQINPIDMSLGGASGVFGTPINALSRLITGKPIINYQPTTQVGQAMQNIGGMLLPAAGSEFGINSPTLATQMGSAFGANAGINALSQYGNTGHVNPIQALATGAIGGVIPAAQGIQRSLASSLGNIANPLWDNAMQQLRNGTNIFDKQITGLPDKVQDAMDMVYPIGDAFNNKFKQMGQYLGNFAKQNIPSDYQFYQQYRNLAQHISNAGDALNTILGHNVSKGINSLNNDEDIPYSQLNNIIDNAINKAGRGSTLNPSGNLASPFAASIKNEIQDSALQKMNPDLLKQKYESSPSSTLDELLMVDRVGLHNVKEMLGHKIKWDADWQPVNSIAQDWHDRFNDILRENNTYAMHNDKFSKLQDLLNDNPWLQNPDQIAAKLSNTDTKSGTLFDTKNKLQLLDNMLPEKYKFMNSINTVIKNHNAQKDLNDNLSNAVFKDLKNYDKADLNTKNAFEELNKLDPNHTLDKYKMLRETMGQNEASRQAIGNVQSTSNILNKKDESLDALNRLNESSGNKFGQDILDLNTQNAFNKKPSPWTQLREINTGGRALLPLAGLIGGGEAIGHGHPLIGAGILGLEGLGFANMNPAYQKAMVQLYGSGLPNKAAGILSSKIGEKK